MADKIDDGGPAFPGDEIVYQAFGTDGLSQGVRRPVPGMSLRDHFAGLALDGAALHLSAYLDDDDPEVVIEAAKEALNVAQGAYMMADAMIAARKGEL